MLTPAAAHTPKKIGDLEYHAHIYLDTERQAYIQKGTTFTDETRNPVKNGEIIVPVRVYKLENGESKDIYQTSFPEWLPYDSLTSGVEGKSVEIAFFSRSTCQLVSYKLLCDQKFVSPEATFENTLQAIKQSIAQPHFENRKPSLKSLIEEAQKDQYNDYHIRVYDRHTSWDYPIDPKILMEFSPFFDKAISSGNATVTREEGIATWNPLVTQKRAVILTLEGASEPMLGHLGFYLVEKKLSSFIGLKDCLGLIGLSATLGNDEQNKRLEKHCLDRVRAKMKIEVVKQVLNSAEGFCNEALVKVVEEFLAEKNENLAHLGLYTIQDCRELQGKFRPMADLIAKGFLEELANLGYMVLPIETYPKRLN